MAAPDQKDPPRRRSWWRPVLGVLAGLAAAGILVSVVLFSRWTTVIPTVPAEIEEVFAAAISDAGGAPPYIEVADTGVVTVRRELETPGAATFATLTVLLWVPGDDEVFRVDCPRWFVRAKTATSFNLGTMIAIWRRDWAHLDLDITYDDLVRRGPALILDHRTQAGARILVWTSGDGP